MHINDYNCQAKALSFDLEEIMFLCDISSQLMLLVAPIVSPG